PVAASVPLAGWGISEPASGTLAATGQAGREPRAMPPHPFWRFRRSCWPALLVSLALHGIAFLLLGLFLGKPGAGQREAARRATEASPLPSEAEFNLPLESLP